MEENPSRLLLWLFQSIKSPVVADFSFLVVLNAQPYLRSQWWSVKNVSGFIYFWTKKDRTAGFLMEYDSCTAMG